ncbi:MAG: urease accessory protein UreE, partial [Inconstantimicrobium porci]|nr:urease accessory protein UreE [Inconstantimicrobium porci]
MIFNEIAGNIKDIKSLEGLHVETIYIDNEDLSKRILRVISDHNREYVISLENCEKLQYGDILFKDDKGIIVVKVNSEDVI